MKRLLAIFCLFALAAGCSSRPPADPPKENSAPVVAFSDVKLKLVEGGRQELPSDASDPDGDALPRELVGAPGFVSLTAEGVMVFDPGFDVVTGTAQSKSFTFQLLISDPTHHTPVNFEVQVLA